MRSRCAWRSSAFCCARRDRSAPSATRAAPGVSHGIETITSRRLPSRIPAASEPRRSRKFAQAGKGRQGPPVSDTRVCETPAACPSWRWTAPVSIAERRLRGSGPLRLARPAPESVSEPTHAEELRQLGAGRLQPTPLRVSTVGVTGEVRRARRANTSAVSADQECYRSERQDPVRRGARQRFVASTPVRGCWFARGRNARSALCDTTAADRREGGGRRVVAGVSEQHRQLPASVPLMQLGQGRPLKDPWPGQTG